MRSRDTRVTQSVDHLCSETNRTLRSSCQSHSPDADEARLNCILHYNTAVSEKSLRGLTSCTRHRRNRKPSLLTAQCVHYMQRLHCSSGGDEMAVTLAFGAEAADELNTHKHHSPPPRTATWLLPDPPRLDDRDRGTADRLSCIRPSLCRPPTVKPGRPALNHPTLSDGRGTLGSMSDGIGIAK